MQAARHLIFQEVALEYLSIYQSQLTNKKQQKAILSELERHAFPVIGRLPISDIRVRDVTGRSGFLIAKSSCLGGFNIQSAQISLTLP